MVFKFLSGLPGLKALTADPVRTNTTRAWEQIIDHSRLPEFYSELGVPDTVEGRYDLLTLHMVLVLRRLADEPDTTGKFGQTLFNIMFRNMDFAMRELGVGDLKVGKKVRELAEMFYGRAKAYETPLHEQDVPALTAKLSRNVWGVAEAPQAHALADFALRAQAHLAKQTVQSLMLGEVRFPDPIEEPK
ncbi:ubiquinol-cytochrome C chaperone family protein [Parvularcula sp. LCG005]|uniref:ubiquinol-cytochrome C chaperone family protein n=1 Tax=Parvularcula sp. LCG005 TaxID=3078805 RepID=UPI0029432E2D|nr:ubiquinol-cytochrome C chaperone family protein [Parvularcula sp. LCG005]WOI54231.1 ubiquinol-cytochrome C chaperone family protein [Parvularcula sp. LCG005]